MSSYNAYNKNLDDLYFNMLEYFNFEKEFTSNLPKNYISSFIICLVDAEEIENWKSLRSFLLEREVPLMDVLKLEDRFVDNFLNKDKKISVFPSEKEFPNLSTDIRAIINNLLSTSIVKLIGLAF